VPKLTVKNYWRQHTVHENKHSSFASNEQVAQSNNYDDGYYMCIHCVPKITHSAISNIFYSFKSTTMKFAQSFLISLTLKASIISHLTIVCKTLPENTLALYITSYSVFLIQNGLCHFLAFHSINQVWLPQVDKAKDDFCLQLYREAQNKPDYSTFQPSLRKFA